MISRRAVSLLAALFAFIAPAFAQSVLQVSVLSNGSFVTVGPGGSVPVTSAGVGQPVQSTVVVRYTGSSTATISGVTVTNSSAFTLQLTPTFPVTLAPNASTSFVVQYLPTSGAPANAVVSVAFSETGQPANNFVFTMAGTTPQLTFSYAFTSGNTTALNNGDTITFAPSNLGTSSGAVVNIVNSGSTTGTLSAITVTGSAFSLSNSPAPTTIIPGQQLSFNIAFAPVASGSAQGVLSIAFATGSVSFALSGTGTAPNLSASYALTNGNVQTLSNGTTITFPPVDINASTSAAITITNQGNGTGSVDNISVSGAAFQLNGRPSLPATLGTGQSLHFNIVFLPTQSGSFTGSFSINMTGAAISGSLAGSTAPSNISLSYIDPSTNNVIPLANNGTLQFPNTLVGSPATVTLVASNSGTGTGTIDSATIGGGSAAVFQLLNLPALPAPVAPNQQTRFAVRFSPTQSQSYGAALAVTISGQNLNINLAGQGVAPQFTYTLSSGATPPTVVAGGTITIANTAVGQTTSTTVVVTNNGTVTGQINGIGVTGAGLSVSGLPAFPATLAAGGSQQFTLNFSPAQPGKVSGTLTVGGDSFTVVSTALGPLLTYSYTNSAGTTTVTAGQSVILPPVAVGNSESITFTMQNTGTSTATISSIGLTAPSTIFTVQQPALPFNLDPNATVSFTIGFLPNNTGVLTAGLAINSVTFVLSGTGTQPAALPAYQFQGPSGNVQPAQQTAVGITLSSNYPLDVQGVLTLTFASAVFTDDPSIEFANGSRTIAFTIPANTKQAVFIGGATSVPLQTGTTAGVIAITPTFTIQGGFNLTPASPNVLSLTVPRSAPQLQSGSITGQTLNSFTLVLTGYSTTRALTQFDIQITPAPGASLSSTHLTVNASSAASAWYQSATSNGFGGSFLVAIPFILQSGNSTANLVALLQSLSITATNDVGVSSAISVAVQ